ncbi:hypothetical protein N658DRAFT_556011 [Parathielavia hyrcaniae]|uniref:Uncharacterized protein n=1 Tax=Parathielavia hyrcaniae TaxID=113614 RepID=A0AAN6T674_9PEZI|nr:hypothetical protein N658DRAFT_556011 [Parathielavia hyrcaniae]
MPTPTVAPFCMLDPLETPGATFHLLDLQSGFIVLRDGRPGTPAPPESKEEAEALLADIEDWQPPLFKFEQPGGAPGGLYDLAGASYTWRVTDTGFTAVTPGETEDGIAVLRPDLSKAIQPSGSGELELARRRQLIRRENGYIPRCPFRGSDIFAHARPGRRPENPNGCGADNGMGSFVPNFNWGHCCDAHDNCYDDCSRSFQGCNNDFLGCMYDQCQADVRWWNWWLFPGCIATANFYWASVSGPFGIDAFYDICLLPNNEVECRTVRGNDSANCGGCDWKYPYKTHCYSGACVCDNHRCGNTCLNLRNNPRNCGACGNVCDNGICYQGRCHKPSAEPNACVPGEAFYNGMFLNGDSNRLVSRPRLVLVRPDAV